MEASVADTQRVLHSQGNGLLPEGRSSRLHDSPDVSRTFRFFSPEKIDAIPDIT